MNTVAKKVSVLGTDYTIRFVEQGQDEYMEKMHFAGYCDGTAHEIVILNLKSCDDMKNEPESSVECRHNCTVRHELTHAFLNESGLKWDAFTPQESWAKNEEMVDWFAIQSPKMFKLFQELGVL